MCPGNAITVACAMWMPEMQIRGRAHHVAIGSVWSGEDAILQSLEIGMLTCWGVVKELLQQRRKRDAVVRSTPRIAHLPSTR